VLIGYERAKEQNLAFKTAGITHGTEVALITVIAAVISITPTDS
jgi:hypothetical protein